MMKKLLLLLLCFVFLTGLKEDRERNKAWQKSFDESIVLCGGYNFTDDNFVCRCKEVKRLMNERIGEKYGFETRECNVKNAPWLISSQRTRKHMTEEGICDEVNGKTLCGKELHETNYYKALAAQQNQNDQGSSQNQNNQQGQEGQQTSQVQVNQQGQQMNMYNPIKEKILNRMGWTQINPKREKILNRMGWTQKWCAGTYQGGC